MTRNISAELRVGVDTRVAASSTYSAASSRQMELLPPFSKSSLLRLSLYEAAMFDAEATAIAVAKRVCYGDSEASKSILYQV